MAGNGTTFDYVIVGGGSAGCVLANRLSADPKNRVCLIEAGKRDRSPFIHIPLGIMYLVEHKMLNWRFMTTNQDNAGGRQIRIPRGRTLGGSSAINGMVYMRGNPLDYDEWAENGCTGWSFREVLPYFKKSENNEKYGGDRWHGKDGPLNVTDVKKRNKLADILLAAAEELQLSRREDFNDDGQEGFGYHQVTQKNGRRHSAATAYLTPIKDRPNLDIITESYCDKVVIEDGRAVGVDIVQAGRQRTIRAEREVLISCGAIVSPAVLMRSGIGDPAELAGHGIECRVNLPAVGKNLQDHATAPIAMNSPSAMSYGISLRSAPRLLWHGLDYLLNRQGLIASNLFEAGGFVKTQPDLPRPDIQYSFLPSLRSPKGRVIGLGHGYTITSILLRPRSRGTVTLRDANPLSAPVIDPRFFSEAEDLEALLRGFKVARRLFDAPAFDAVRGEEMKPGKHVQSDDDLRQFIRDNSATVFHPVATCSMGEGPDSVVDSELRVRGVAGLRVVDASVMPLVIGGNTNAPTIMIAERASDLILGKPLLPPAELPNYRQKAA